MSPKDLRLLLVASLVLLAFLVWRSETLSSDVHRMAQALGLLTERVERIEPLAVEAGEVSTTWISGGTTHTCTTSRYPGESDADLRARHFKAVTDEQNGPWPLDP